MITVKMFPSKLDHFLNPLGQDVKNQIEPGKKPYWDGILGNPFFTDSAMLKIRKGWSENCFF